MKLGIIGRAIWLVSTSERVGSGMELNSLLLHRNMERTSAFASAHGIIKAFIKIEDMIESVQLYGIVVAVPELPPKMSVETFAVMQGYTQKSRLAIMY